jgi:AraC-like DNA-binding protein
VIRSGSPASRSVSACDVAEATSALKDVYQAVTLRVGKKQPRLQMRLQTLDLWGGKLAKLNITNATIVTEPYPYYTVVLPSSGRLRLSTTNDSASLNPKVGAVLTPGGPVRADYPANAGDVVTLVIEPQALHDELATMLGRHVKSPLNFAFRLDPTHSTPFRRAMSLLNAELAAPAGMTDSPRTSGHLARLVIAGLLLSQPHDFSRELLEPAGLLGPATVRAAVAAIEERAAEILTVADIARASNISVRALENGFRRHLGMPPMKYLRQLRMTRAHQELLGADPTRTTATSVALKWHFAHYGRFAADYRRRYGCQPSETLRRT